MPECTFCHIIRSHDGVDYCRTNGCKRAVCLDCGYGRYYNYESYLKCKTEEKLENPNIKIYTEEEFDKINSDEELDEHYYLEEEMSDVIADSIICGVCVEVSELRKENVQLKNEINKLKLLLISNNLTKDSVKDIYEYLKE